MVLPRESIQLIGSWKAHALDNPFADGRHPAWEGEIGVNDVAVRPQDSEHLEECLMPIGDMVRHLVGHYEIEFVVAERQLRSVDGEEAGFRGFLAHRPCRFNLLRVDVYSRHG